MRVAGIHSVRRRTERLVRRRLGASRRSTAPTLHSTRRADACRKTNDSAELDTSRCSTVIQRRRKRFEAEQVEISRQRWLLLHRQKQFVPLCIIVKNITV